MLKFAAIGECMIEMRPTDAATYVMNFAGDTANTAIYLSRYQQKIPAEVAYVTAVGDSDPYSEQMLNFFRQEQLATQFIVKIPECLPGLYFIHTDQSGERQFYYYRSQSAAKFLFSSLQSTAIWQELIHYDYLYLSGITLAILNDEDRRKLIANIALAKNHGAKICFDSNYRSLLWQNVEQAKTWYLQLLPYVDIGMPTLSDDELLFGDHSAANCAQRWHDFGASEVVVKLGEKGCFVSDGTQQSFLAGQTVQAIDTTAAGDSFNAAYLAARMQNLPLAAAAEKGHQLARVVVQHRGAIIPLSAMPKLF